MLHSDVVIAQDVERTDRADNIVLVAFSAQYYVDGSVKELLCFHFD